MNTGLKLALKEGIEARAQRHAFHQTGLKAALKALGLEIYGDEENEMKMVICIKIPNGVDDATFREGLLKHYGIEIAGSFGDLQGKIWRIGIMGYAVEKQNILTFLSVFSLYLAQQGVTNLEPEKHLLHYYNITQHKINPFDLHHTCTSRRLIM